MCPVSHRNCHTELLPFSGVSGVLREGNWTVSRRAERMDWTLRMMVTAVAPVGQPNLLLYPRSNLLDQGRVIVSSVVKVKSLVDPQWNVLLFVPRLPCTCSVLLTSYPFLPFLSRSRTPIRFTSLPFTCVSWDLHTHLPHPVGSPSPCRDSWVPQPVASVHSSLLFIGDGGSDGSRSRQFV